MISYDLLTLVVMGLWTVFAVPVSLLVLLAARSGRRSGKH